MWKWLLKRVMNYIVGNDVFGKTQVLVESVALDDTLTGAQKKDKVKTEVKKFATEVKSHLVNLAIEASVALVREKTNTK